MADVPDLADLADLNLKEGTGSWAGAPLTRDSAYPVSVYERPGRL